jgi:peptide-methionine (R)-S-oxide reductase
MDKNKVFGWNDVIKLANNGNPFLGEKIIKKEADWKAQLTEEEYFITRQKGTEARFSGEHCSRYEPGIYACICCDTPLFDSTEKFESGTGWPSFTQPIQENNINYHKDTSYGMVRVEVMCNACDAHLGHVFPDGPEPTGLRFCINSVSLKKV